MDTLHRPTLEQLRVLGIKDTAKISGVGTDKIREVITYLTEHHDRGFEPSYFLNHTLVKRVK